MISAREHPKKTVEILGRRMAYVEMGEGDPIVYLHGNPTSSYLWRNIMPHTESLGRSLAIDLVGMGDSEPLDDSGPGRYRFVEHREYLDAALDALGVTGAGNAVFVVHDWGPRSASTGRTAIATRCRASSTWRPWSGRSPGRNGRKPHGGCSRDSAPTPARTW